MAAIITLVMLFLFGNLTLLWYIDNCPMITAKIFRSNGNQFHLNNTKLKQQLIFKPFKYALKRNKNLKHEKFVSLQNINNKPLNYNDTRIREKSSSCQERVRKSNRNGQRCSKWLITSNEKSSAATLLPVVNKINFLSVKKHGHNQHRAHHTYPFHRWSEMLNTHQNRSNDKSGMESSIYHNKASTSTSDTSLQQIALYRERIRRHYRHCQQHLQQQHNYDEPENSKKKKKKKKNKHYFQFYRKYCNRQHLKHHQLLNKEHHYQQQHHYHQRNVQHHFSLNNGIFPENVSTDRSFNDVGVPLSSGGQNHNCNCDLNHVKSSFPHSTESSQQKQLALLVLENQNLQHSESLQLKDLCDYHHNCSQEKFATETSDNNTTKIYLQETVTTNSSVASILRETMMMSDESSIASTSITHLHYWPVKREAVMDGNIILGGLMMVHSREDSVTCGPIMPQGGIQALEAMLYTIDQINAIKLLPNITLGAHVLDDCDKDSYGLEMAVDFIKGKRLHFKQLTSLIYSNF